MKYLTQISSIIVALVFLYALNFKSLITFNYFINQAEITELFCVNKEKTQLNCNGKCHLVKTLLKVDSNKSELPFSKNIYEYSLELVFNQIDNIIINSIFSIIKTKKWLILSESLIKLEIDIPTPPPKK